MRALHDGGDDAWIENEAFVEHGLIRLDTLNEEDDIDRFTSAAVTRWVPRIERFIDAWDAASGRRRLWLAAQAGDWLYVAEQSRAAGFHELLSLAGRRAERIRRRRVQELRRRISRDGCAASVFSALHRVDAEHYRRAVDSAFVRGGRCAREAVVSLARTGDPGWSREVYRVFCRCYRSPLELNTARAAAEYLLRDQGQVGDVLHRLTENAAGLRYACALALKYAPEHALPLVHQALHSADPLDREYVAALLGIIDRPWSRRELTLVLAEATGGRRAAECRVALRMSRRDHVRRVAVQFGDYCRDKGPFNTTAEESTTARIVRAMDHFRADLPQLRAQSAPRLPRGPRDGDRRNGRRW